MIYTIKRNYVMKLICVVFLVICILSYSALYEPVQVHAIFVIDDAIIAIFIIATLLIATGIVLSDPAVWEAFENGTGQLYSLAKSIYEEAKLMGDYAYTTLLMLVYKYKSEFFGKTVEVQDTNANTVQLTAREIDVSQDEYESLYTYFDTVLTDSEKTAQYIERYDTLSENNVNVSDYANGVEFFFASNYIAYGSYISPKSNLYPIDVTNVGYGDFAGDGILEKYLRINTSWSLASGAFVIYLDETNIQNDYNMQLKFSASGSGIYINPIMATTYEGDGNIIENLANLSYKQKIDDGTKKIISVTIPKKDYVCDYCIKITIPFEMNASSYIDLYSVAFSIEKRMAKSYSDFHLDTDYQHSLDASNVVVPQAMPSKLTIPEADSIYALDDMAQGIISYDDYITDSGVIPKDIAVRENVTTGEGTTTEGTDYSGFFQTIIEKLQGIFGRTQELPDETTVVGKANELKKSVEDVNSSVGVISGKADAIRQSVDNVNSSINVLTDTSGAINFEPLKKVGTLFTTAFPFSLPFDLYNSFAKVADVQAREPNFDIQLNTPLLGEVDFDIDISMWRNLIAVMRTFELICFDIGLIFVTRKLLGGAV